MEPNKLEGLREIASEAQQFLIQDEFYSPLFLFFGGLAVWAMAFAFRKWTEFRFRKGRIQMDSRMIEALMYRFQSRAKVSWVMMVFGGVWFLQLLAEKSGLVDWLAAR